MPKKIKDKLDRPFKGLLLNGNFAPTSLLSIIWAIQNSERVENVMSGDLRFASQAHSLLSVLNTLGTSSIDQKMCKAIYTWFQEESSYRWDQFLSPPKF